MTDLHIKIKQYRVVYIALLLFICYTTWDMWSWYKVNAEDIELAASGAFASAFLAFAGMLKFALENLRSDSEHD